MQYTEATDRRSRCAWATRHWEPCVIASSVVLGAVLGLSLQGQSLNQRHRMYIAFPGEVYARMLAMLFVPLKVSCIVGSIGSTSYRTGGKMLRCALAYWVLSAASAAAVAFGTTLLLRAVRNETASSLQLSPAAPLNVTALRTTDLAMDMIRGLFPANIVDVSMKTWPSKEAPRVSELWADESRKPCSQRYQERDSGADYENPLRRVSGLGLLSFTVALGFVLAHNADDRNVLLNFFINLSNGIASISRLLSWFLPLGLMSLTADGILEAAGKLRSAPSVSLLLTYSLNVVVAVLVHTFIVLPLIQWLLVLRWNRGMVGFIGQTYMPLVVTANTRSMAASLPLGVSVLEMKCGLDARVVRTVLPLGIVLGRSGSVAQLAVSVLFLTHIHRPVAHHNGRRLL
ncbi:excitatory amino acid transporter 1-like isoform X2 [Dermacentor albipictus]|uniref:excitatory amino acid transporter 1-like isoform X2 n=1 Tax=Dermacentor albipictus TaxID=60249 RepID=UPI0031FCFEE1